MANFEDDLRDVLGQQMNDDDFARRVYASLCNIDWVHENGTEYSCTWRYAGGLVAEIRDRDEDYMDFYCTGNEGVIDAEVADAMEAHGWSATAT